MSKQRTEHEAPGPFYIEPPVHTCLCCGDRDTLNCFGRCRDCEVAYLERSFIGIVADLAITRDGQTNHLLMTEIVCRANELRNMREALSGR